MTLEIEEDKRPWPILPNGEIDSWGYGKQACGLVGYIS